MSWLFPCCRSGPPLAMGWRLGDVWLRGRGVSSSPSLLLLSSPLPEALPESEELLLPLLLICSITSTSARSSVKNSRESLQLTQRHSAFTERLFITNCNVLTFIQNYVILKCVTQHMFNIEYVICDVNHKLQLCQENHLFYYELWPCITFLTSLDVIELRLWGGVVLRWGRRGFDPSPGFSGGPKLRGGLAGPKRLLLNPGLDLTAAFCPVKHTHNRCDFTWIYLRVTQKPA